ncbi:MAG: putative isochorismatase hydrolase [Chlamydiia bacterium]|nr:putative isochorismatase hydrolase [Chlamydiia bacterium]
MDTFLLKESTGLLVVDIQEKLFQKMYQKEDLLKKLGLVIEAAKILQLPIILSEQYPQGLGSTVSAVQTILEPVEVFEKTTFSCLGSQALQEAIAKKSVKNWLIIGIETHICILQTAKDFLTHDLQPVVITDATSSRNLVDHKSAIKEMRTLGIRCSTAETILFELVRDAKAKEFKAISQLVK